MSGAFRAPAVYVSPVAGLRRIGFSAALIPALVFHFPYLRRAAMGSVA